MIKVLIVEDNAYLIDFYQTLVSTFRKEIDVEVATSGKTTIELLKKQKYDKILLDLILPDMNGQEILDILEKETNIDFKTITILTNINDRSERDTLNDRGIKNYFVKAELSNADLEKILSE